MWGGRVREWGGGWRGRKGERVWGGGWSGRKGERVGWRKEREEMRVWGEGECCREGR